MLKLAFLIVAVFAFVNCQGPPNGIIWEAHPQEPHQHPMPQHIHHVEAHAREAQGEEETLGSPMLGTPLIGLKMAMAKPFLFGIPGMRFSDFKMGHIGAIKHGHFLLGAENPYAAEADHHYHGAHYHQAEANLGAPQHYHGAHYHQAEAPLGAPQPYEGAHYHYHQAEANLGAPQQYDSYNLGAPGDQDAPKSPAGPFAPLFPIIQPGSLFATPAQPLAPEQRTWDKG